MGQIQSLRHDITLILRLVVLGTGAFLAIASLLIPRRPLVFYEDELVDENFGVTALNRNTWAWGRKILDLGSKHGDLQQKDVPRPPSYARSKSLVKRWESVKFDGTLFRNLFHAYGYRFAFQWFVTFFRIFLSLGPYIVMFKLIETLETMPAEERTFAALWRYVFGLAAFTLAENWIEGWLSWYAIAGMAIPISAQLSALIFEKSLRRKNVKMADKNDADAKDDEVDSKKKDVKKDAKDTKTKDDGDATVLKSRQAIVNLVGVDSRRIADFLAMHYFIIHSIAKLIIYSFFLVRLIGIKPFIAGFLAWAVVLPINVYASKLYLKKQDKFMKVRDEKLAIINEALLGIRQIKFSALEKEWSERILAKRNQELGIIKYLFIVDSVLMACWIVSPILLALVALSTYAIIHGEISASVAFVSIGLFKSLEVSLSVLPEFIGFCLDTLISIRRVGAYLDGPEIKKVVTDGHDVAFDNASIAWPVDAEVPEEERFVLRNLNLSFPRGELSVISGKTGTGKSLLISSLLGEADLLDGTVLMPPTVKPEDRHDSKAHPGNWLLDGAVAFVGQTPWLESASFRDNILFGLPYDEERYNAVIDVCALKKDLDILTDGDKTELGANGINLSGGQKWRVTLARAVYSRAEILVMDDIFSAVDAHVGRQIFEKCIAGPICQGRTVILVTHHVALVNKKTKYLVELGEGTILHAGLTSDLEEDGTLQKIKSNGQSESEIQAEERTQSSTVVNSEEASEDEEEAANALHKVNSKQEAKKYIEDETHEKGSVKKHIYGTYLRATGGLPFWIACAFLYVGYEAGNVGRNWWLQIWTGGQQKSSASANANFLSNSTSSPNPLSEFGMSSAFSYQHGALHAAARPPVHLATESSQDLAFYLGIYGAIALASGIVGCLRIVIMYYMSLRASRILFRQILHTVVRTPLRWLDTVPVGRILNRMTADFDVIDNRLANSTSFFVARILGLCAICAASTLVTPYVLPFAGVLVIVAGVIGKKYMDGARPMKRLESSSKSPVFELFNATLAGVSTLRAFSKTGDYIRKMHYSLDTWNTNRIHFWIFNRWMGLRMALVGTAFTTCVGLLIAIMPISASMAGFSLTFALDFASTILFALRAYAGVELDMNAAERVVEYSELKTEDQGGEQPSAAWPTTGTMKVEELVVGYADGLPAVLRGISFEVSNNERVGVIGRTGAGKSSLTLALFRFLEARSGKVVIDGVDISKIDLHSLRSRLAIIPQVSKQVALPNTFLRLTSLSRTPSCSPEPFAQISTRLIITPMRSSVNVWEEFIFWIRSQAHPPTSLLHLQTPPWHPTISTCSAI